MARTTLRLLAALGIASAALVAAAAPAWASGETIGGCVLEQVLHAEEQYGSLHALEEGPKEDLERFEDDLEGCVEAPSPIIPELDEIIWGGAAFAILFAFMWWKGFPAVKRAMDARAEKIRADLDAADAAKADALRTKSEYEAQLAEAKSAAGAVIDEARAQADRLRQDLQAAPRTTSPSSGPGPRPTSSRAAARPSTICAPRWLPSRWARPSGWLAPASTPTCTGPSSTATSTRWPGPAATGTGAEPMSREWPAPGSSGAAARTSSSCPHHRWVSRLMFAATDPAGV